MSQYINLLICLRLFMSNMHACMTIYNSLVIVRTSPLPQSLPYSGCWGLFYWGEEASKKCISCSPPHPKKNTVWHLEYFCHTSNEDFGGASEKGMKMCR